MARFHTGIDIGTTHARVVVLKRSRQGWRWHAGAEARCQDDEGLQRPLDEILRELKRRVPMRGPVCLSDSTQNVLVRFLAQPPLDGLRLQRGMRMELIQHADTNGNLAADYMVLPIEGEELTVCCALAQPPQVDGIFSFARKRGITLDQIGLPMAGPANAVALLERQLEAARRAASRSAQESQLQTAVDLDDLDDEELDTLVETDDEEDADESYESVIEDTVLVLDIGAASCRVVLLQAGVFLACRNLAIGGQRFTEELAMSRGIDLRWAEHMKTSGEASPRTVDVLRAAAGTDAVSEDDDALFDDETSTHVIRAETERSASEELRVVSDEYRVKSDEMLILLEDQPAAQQEDDAPLDTELAAVAAQDAPGQDTVEIGERQLGSELRRTAENLYMQIASSVNWFRVQLKQPRLQIDRIVCVGGGAHLAGLDAYLAQRFRVPVITPGMEDFASLGEELPDDIDRFTCAIGNALPRSEQVMNFDLRSQDLQASELRRTVVRYPLIAAGLLAAASILFLFASWQQQANDATSITRYRKQEQLFDKGKRELETQRATNQALQEDLRGIAARIFSGRDLLHTIRVLKERAPDELWITELRTETVSTGQSTEDDTAIDRGSLFIEGRVKPLDGQYGDSDRMNRFDEWVDAVLTWRPVPEAPSLYQAKKVLSVQGSDLTENTATREAIRSLAGKGEFSFRVRFDFRPTQIDEVARSVDGQREPGP